MDDFQKAEKLMEVKDAESEAIASLQEQLRDCQKARQADLFFFIFILIIFFDAILFVYLVDGWAAIAMAFLEITFLILLADRFDIKYVEIVFARCAGVWNGARNAKTTEE